LEDVASFFTPKYASLIVDTLVLKSSSLEYSTSSASLLNFSFAVSAKSADASSMMSCLFKSPLALFSSTFFSICSLSLF